MNNASLEDFFAKATTFGKVNMDPTIQNLRIEKRTAEISTIKKLNHNTVEIKLKCRCPVTGELSGLGGKAGQFITVRAGGIAKPRAYSFALPPEMEEEGTHTFMIRLVPNGEFSQWITDQNHLGENVEIQGPFGNFCLNDSQDDLIFIAGGSGISAIISLLRSAAENGCRRHADLVYGVRQRKDLCCIDELRSLEAAWNKDFRYTFHPVLSEEPEHTDWQGGRGMIADFIQQHYLDRNRFETESSEVFLCGPPPMVTAVQNVLTDSSFPESKIFFDKFEDASSPAPVLDNLKCVLCDECLLVKPVENCIVTVSSLSRGKDGSEAYRPVQPEETAGLYYHALRINSQSCIRCYACVDACPVNAIDSSNSLELNTIAKTVPDA